MPIGGDIGQGRHRFHNFREGRLAGQVAHDEGGHDPLPQVPQRGFQITVVSGVCVVDEGLHRCCTDRCCGVFGQPVCDGRS
jgi:hypothetical protein